MKIGIIGAGITGLTCAYDLSKLGHHVTVFESSNLLGGHASTFEVQGTPLERGYHHWFTNDHDIINLMEEIGLVNQIDWKQSKVGTFSNGNLYNFSTPLDILRYSPLTMRERILLGLSARKIRNIKHWQSIEHLTAVEWLQKNVDIKAYQHFWLPMLQGKFGKRHYKNVGMAWLWGKMNTRFKSRKNILSRETLGYPKGSFKALFDRLSHESQKHGAEIRLNTSVKEIHAVNKSVYGISTHQSRQIELFDAVICTTPSHIYSNLIRNIQGQVTNTVHEVKYMAAVLLILVLKEPFTKYYWLNIADSKMPFVGVIEHTNLIPQSNYNGRTIIYISNYVEPDDPLLNVEKSDLLKMYIPHLRKINTKFNGSWIMESFHQSIPDAQPVIEKNYSSKIQSHKTPVKNLYLGNTSQIYPEDRGTNYGVTISRRITKMLLETNGF